MFYCVQQRLIGHGWRSFWILPPCYYLTGGGGLLQEHIKQKHVSIIHYRTNIYAATATFILCEF